MRKFSLEKIAASSNPAPSKAILPRGIYGRNFGVRILRRRLFSLLALFWRALNELLAVKFRRKFCKKFALFAFPCAPHKILRRSCRDFTPILRRFLEYKARKLCCRPPHRNNFHEGGCAARAIVDGNVTLCGKNFTCNSPQNFERILPQ